MIVKIVTPDLGLLAEYTEDESKAEAEDEDEDEDEKVSRLDF
jgi:hypothetical protein